MTKFIKSFLSGEDGAVTVDWVMLCAAVIAFSAIGLDLITDSAVTVSNRTGAVIASQAD